MTFRDAIALVLGVLAAAEPDVEGGSKVPPERPEEFFWVRRTGGHVTGRVVDHPQITVTAWAGDSVRALALADVGRDAVIEAARTSRGWHATQVASLYDDPDPDSRASRATFTAFLTIRAARS